jgi:PilZ domain
MVSVLRPEQRHRPRTRVSWPVTVQAGNRSLQGETLDLSPGGAKLRLGERLQEGDLATLRIRPPQGGAMDVNAIVWRSDDDGPAFFFIDAVPAFSQLQN